ncbi:MAG: adenylosuccinate lyase, partial [Cyclobacteriaceae bacterium]|nr:adenylosuccinate lyase [Cyclobacteriaceae bacterium]
MDSVHFYPFQCNAYIQELYVLHKGIMKFKGYYHEDEENFPMESLLCVGKDIYWILIHTKKQSDMDTSGSFYDETVGGDICLFPSYTIELTFSVIQKNPIKEKFEEIGLSAYKEFIHFGLTSQDINNTATPLMLKQGLEQVILPQLDGVISQIHHLATQWDQVPMLAKTHGQPASPTRLGKELEVFVVRLQQQLLLLRQVPFAAKFGGATGNLNAHQVAYPNLDWNGFAKNFVEKSLGLTRSYPTTQIEHYDHMAAIFDGLKRINTILLDLSRDVWQYVSMNYFKQKIKAGEVGSSAMPHKVNPIDFENAEGNLGIANALLEHLAAKLPISRLQRDLSDSTVLRTIGVPLAHQLIALGSIEKGLSKLELNEEVLKADLEENWAVVAEAIQTILRREGFPKPYEALRDLTRTHTKITKASLAEFIEGLPISG